jgi:uncharacterized protein YgiM (DUF1202 family)
MISRKTVIRMLVTLAFTLMTMMSVMAQGNANVRFVHAIPGAGAVDIYINGGIALSNVNFGEASTYLSVPAGEHTVTVTPTGIATPLWEQAISASDGQTATFIASDPSTLQFDAYLENLNTTEFGSTRLLLIHAVADAPEVDVVLAEPVMLNGALQDAGTALANAMGYRAGFGDFDLPAQTYSVNVLVSGTSDIVLENVDLKLTSGTSHIAIVYGTAAQPQALLTSAMATPNDGDGFVRFAHGIVGAPAVDVYVNDTLLVPGLTPDQPSQHIGLPAGEHSVLLRAAGTEDEVISGSLVVDGSAAQTVVAIADADGAQLASFADDISGVSGESVVASVINAVPDATLDVVLDNGTLLATGTAFGEASDVASFAPVSAMPNFSLTIGDQTGALDSDSIVFYGGNYYNIIALAGDTFNAPRLVIAPTSLQQGLASAPGGSVIAGAVDAVQPADNTTSDVVDTAATPEPQATTAPADQPVSVDVPEDAVTARVLLDPGANLQLRQYPSPEAASLGLAPSGSTLIVTGREGAPVALVEGQEPPPEAADYVDPATLLADEDEDLVPEETWLRINYQTADGGQIIAWVNALYLEVRDADGDLQRLADLETVGGNIPGEAVNTAVTPPPPPEERVTAIVINLNPDAALNVRRTPTIEGEVLARLSLNTITEFVGIIEPNEDGEQNWYFISYLPAEGGVITGWASANFLTLQYNGNDTDLEELTVRELLDEISPEQRGEVAAGAPSVDIPTPDPLEDAYVAVVQLDPGANLQFRLSPDATSESLNLVPSGTQLIVSARTPAGDWLQATFEGQVGWIAADFVTLSFNGDFVEVEEVPVDETLIETTTDS